MFVLAVHADEGQVASIELPAGGVCQQREGELQPANLAITAEGKLSVLIVDGQVGDSGVGHVGVVAGGEVEQEGAVIGRRGIHEQVAGGWGRPCFQGFREWSGAAVVQIDIYGRARAARSGEVDGRAPPRVSVGV